MGRPTADKRQSKTTEVPAAVAENTYDLMGLLRGQAGTDGIMPENWPENSRFVLLDGAAQQIGMDIAHRDLERHYRIGSSSKSYEDPSFRHYVESFKGVGLRPYSPAHLRCQPDASGWNFVWIRRTRIDGDSWSSVDVPLGEDVERYFLKVVKDDAVIRELVVSEPSWTYTTAMAVADNVSAPFEIQAAQISQSFGPGPLFKEDHSCLKHPNLNCRSLRPRRRKST